MNYVSMSDFEINSAVAAAKGYDTNVKQHFADAGLSLVKTTEGTLDFCNSWADAGPIIERYRITIMPASQGENWMAQAFEYALADVSIRPLRSAMIVFLMMQERT